MKKKNSHRSKIKIAFEDQTCELDEILAKAFNNCMQIILKYHTLLLKTYNENNLHQLRVGLRKFKSFLHFFRDEIPADEFKQANDILKQLLRPTSRVRDIDVIASTIIIPLFEKTKTTPEAHSLLEDLNAQLSKHHADISIELSSSHYRKLIEKINDWKSSDQWRSLLSTKHPDAEAIIRKKISRLDKLINKSMNQITSLPQNKLHKLRINVKELRYVLDILYPNILVNKPYLKYLKKMQENLGIINDTYVAEASLQNMNTDNRWNSFLPYIEAEVHEIRSRNLEQLKNISLKH